MLGVEVPADVQAVTSRAVYSTELLSTTGSYGANGVGECETEAEHQSVVDIETSQRLPPFNRNHTLPNVPDCLLPMKNVRACYMQVEAIL